MNHSPYNVLQILTMEKIEDKVIARMVGHMAMPINVNDKLMVRMAPDNQTFNSKINSAPYSNSNKGSPRQVGEIKR